MNIHFIQPTYYLCTELKLLKKYYLDYTLDLTSGVYIIMIDVHKCEPHYAGAMYIFVVVSK